MALISCPECGQTISEYAPTCPHCGVTVFGGKSRPTKPVTFGPSGEKPVWPKALAGFFLLLIVASCITGNSTKRQPAGLTETSAMALCMRGIQLASKDPERAEIPWVEPHVSDAAYSFTWGHSTRMLRLRNGFGLEVASSGYCSVDRVKKEIINLTVEGTKFL